MHDEARERGGKIHAARGDRADRLQHLLQRLRLARVPEGADLQRFGRVLLVQHHAQHENAATRRPPQQLAGDGDSRRCPQQHVQNHEIGILRIDEGACLRGFRGFADDLEVGLRREQRAQSFAEKPVVVDERDPIAHGGLPIVHTL